MSHVVSGFDIIIDEAYRVIRRCWHGYYFVPYCLGNVRMIVKVCGITTLADAQMALGAGADWIGLNLVAGPRRIDLTDALSILSDLADPYRAVALVNLKDEAADESTLSALAKHDVHRLQLYGQVTAQGVATLSGRGFDIIYVQPVGDERSFDELDSFLTAFDAGGPEFVLFDSAVKGRVGGTGQAANWEAIARARELGLFEAWPPVILAGGLTPENVATAISRTLPDGVDVSTGVESAPGHKDPRKVEAFLKAVYAGS